MTAFAYHKSLNYYVCCNIIIIIIGVFPAHEKLNFEYGDINILISLKMHMGGFSTSATIYLINTIKIIIFNYI